ncbi:DUF4142 domain-containing protein [Actinomadura rupiterrae]|uniref:DUF4142 domain-containing protein n=1 Tax=Actinomadura rupiterrae TaxID=559627 RepID=UPI0020A31B23|nr:DUF4142 domain-containing protein [Actinomadura rupiterrae]MCP2342432.1 putative membrane protein [Actinomadura rupiterrae]
MSITRWPAAAAAAVIVMAGAACGYGASAPAAQPSSSPVRPLPTGQLTAQDRTWLGQAHQGNLAEGELGELARSKSTSPQVQSEGAMLVDAHTQMEQSLVTTAHRLDVKLPPGPTAEQAAKRQELAGLTGPAFDNELVADLITDHQQAIGMTQYEVNHGSDPVVKGMAQQAIPEMQKHLDILKQAQH